MDWAWAIRGWMDKAIGGVGIRRGRRHPDEIRAGEVARFLACGGRGEGPPAAPAGRDEGAGKAWLQFESTPLPHGETLLVQTAYFAPRGLLGFLYWYAMWPFHAFLFDGLIRRVCAARMLARLTMRRRTERIQLLSQRDFQTWRHLCWSPAQMDSSPAA